MAGPVIVPAAAGNGLTVTAKFADTIPFPHPLEPTTVILPLVALADQLTVILFVFDPAVITAPAGMVQMYPVAEIIAGMVYTVPDWFWHTVAGPVMIPAAAGSGFTVTV